MGCSWPPKTANKNINQCLSGFRPKTRCSNLPPISCRFKFCKKKHVFLKIFPGASFNHFDKYNWKLALIFFQIIHYKFWRCSQILYFKILKIEKLFKTQRFLSSSNSPQESQKKNKTTLSKKNHKYRGRCRRRLIEVRRRGICAAAVVRKDLILILRDFHRPSAPFSVSGGTAQVETQIAHLFIS